jgi:methyl-accepting chemotaxis protein
MITNTSAFLRAKFLSIPIGWTLSLVLLLGIVPALVMGKYYISAQMSDIAKYDNELVGAKLLSDLRPVGEFAVNPSEDAETRRNQAKQALIVLKNAVSKNPVEGLDPNKDAKLLITRLKLLSNGVEVEPLPAYDNFVRVIGDRSGLILDPNLDSYYLMDIVLIKSMKLERAVNELQQAYPNIENADDPLFLIKRHQISSAARDLSQALSSAIDGDTYGIIENSKVPETTNQVVNAVNALTASKEINYDHTSLHRAIDVNWKTTNTVLQAVINEHKNSNQNQLYLALMISGLAILGVVMAAGLLIFSLTDGLRLISNRLMDLSDGDYVSDVPFTQFNNDIGVIANALQAFIDLSGQVEAERNQSKAKLEQAIEKVQNENKELLSKALSQQAEASEIERAMIAKLAAQLEDQVSGLLADSGVAAQQMKLEASAMSGSSSGVQKDAAAAAHAADDIRKAVESVAPAVESVSRQLTQYTASLSDAESLANDAVARVDAANQRITEFNTATKRASSMLDLITNVAHKTNMLALNASIEAARVGEAGMGFMVVADEVKSLALSTRNAAMEISAQIASMENANTAVTSAFEQVLDVVNTLASRSINVASGMSNQAEAITEVELAITAASNELAYMLNSINSADHSAAAAIIRSNEVLNASENVSSNFNQLDQTVRHFLSNIQNTQNKAA